MGLKPRLKQLFYVLFSYKGRISHWTYRRHIIYEFYFIVFTGLLCLLVFPDELSTNQDSDPSFVAILICMPATVWMFYCNIPIAVKRLHDLNRPGWNLIWGWGCIPLIGASIVSIILYHKAGTDGPNDFGDKPPENRLKWWHYLVGALPITLYFLMTVVSIVVLIMFVLSLFIPGIFSP